jgi:hypothetical protein
MILDLHVKVMKTLKMNNMNFTNCQFDPTGNGQRSKNLLHQGYGGRELAGDFSGLFVSSLTAGRQVCGPLCNQIMYF